MGIFHKKKKTGALQEEDLQKTLHKNMNFLASEQYRLLRTNIKFTMPEDVKCPVIGVTSSVRGEGKSTTAINLSYVLAEKGSRVLLIDGDLRIPSVAKKMCIRSKPGLTDMLLGTKIDMETMQSEVHPNWYILPAGDIPPNPSELLGSGRMRRAINGLKEQFDYIVIDLPPVNLVSDAMSVADNLTGMIVVVRQEYTGRKDLEQCFRQIELSNVRVLGFVMNASEDSSASYGRYGKYKKYRKYRKYRNYHYYKYYKYERYESTPSGDNAGGEQA